MRRPSQSFRPLAGLEVTGTKGAAPLQASDVEIVRSMRNHPLSQLVERHVPDLATAATSAGFVATMAAANQLLQLVAGILAVISGLFAVYWHVQRLKGRRDDHDKADGQSGPGGGVLPQRPEDRPGARHEPDDVDGGAR